MKEYLDRQRNSKNWVKTPNTKLRLLGVTDLLQYEINELDVRTRILLYAYQNQCMARIYMPRNTGGYGITVYRRNSQEINRIMWIWERKRNTKYMNWVKGQEERK